MAGLFAIFGPPQRERVVAGADRLMFSEAEARVVEAVDGLSFAWTSFDDPALFGPAHDPATGVRIVTSGRVSFDEADWQRAERLTQYEGGLSPRLLLDAYLDRGPEALERPDGPACVLAWDPRTREAHLVTDAMGYHPVFVYRPDDARRCVVCTHPDALADDPDVKTTPDLTTVAEFFSFWRATPPHTYYQEIKYARPAWHWRWNLETETATDGAYWAPYTEAPYPGLDEAAEDLAAALSGAVRRRTLGRLGTSLVYASGGMDSRAILFGAAPDADVVGLNMYEVFNHESDITRQLCEAAGARYVGFRRDDDYYPRWVREGARWSGAMWSAEDYHFLGTWAAARELGARTVLSGCTADRMFKASPMDKRYRTLFGKALPLKELAPYRTEGFLPNRPRRVPEPHREAVRARFLDRFGDLPTEFSDDRDWLLVEDRRVRPHVFGSSVSGAMTYRIFPYDTFLADRAVIDVYARSKAAWKVNADLWGRAVARIAGANRVPVAHAGWRTDASTATKLAVFAKGWVRRRLGPTETSPPPSDGPATAGSWPRLGWYLEHSDTLRELWESAPEEDREVVRAAWGDDPWATPLDPNAWRPNDAFRILTMLAYWQNRRADAASALGGPAGASALSPRPEASPLFDPAGLVRAPEPSLAEA